MALFESYERRIDNINKVLNINFEELSQIDGIGEIIAQKWIETLNDDDFKDQLLKLLKIISSALGSCL